jgi:hypothetical protein
MRHVPVRQRAGDRVGGGVPLRAADDAGSIAVLNMDDAGDVAPAAAMAMTIFFAATLVRAVYTLLVRGVLTRTQAWRKR